MDLESDRRSTATSAFQPIPVANPSTGGGTGARLAQRKMTLVSRSLRARMVSKLIIRKMFSVLELSSYCTG